MKNKTVFADLHVHSTASDGLLSPVQLVQKSAGIGLSVLGITDHDTIDGIKPARAECSACSLKLVPGIELSCGWEGRDSSVHVLGLFIDEDSPELLTLLESQKESRYHRALKIVSLLAKEGFDVSELQSQFENSRDKVLGRPHIARFLMDKGYIKDFQEAFDRYLSRGKPAYVPKDHVLPEEGIRIIHAAGGIAILAHPGLIPDWDRVWAKIGDMPWDGIETYYSEHKNSDIERFKKIVAKRNMLATGGSDYHGDYGKHIDRLGQAGLSEQQFAELLEKCSKRGVSFS